nr:MAG TPA_asm: hypothetical protein [Bacteriophage sp.]
MLRTAGYRNSVLEKLLKLFHLQLVVVNPHTSAIIIGVMQVLLIGEHSWWVVALLMVVRPVLALSVLIMGSVMPMPMLALEQ